MAIFNSALYALQKTDRLNTSRLPAPNQAGGAVQLAVVPYTTAGTEAAGDTINLCTLPAGAIPIPGLSFLEQEDPSADAVTIDVGFASDADALADGMDCAGAGHIAFTSAAVPAAGLVPAALASTDATIVAKFATAAAAITAAKKMVFNIAYKVPA
jgi:hypothetical protein